MKTKLILDVNKTQHAQLNSIVTGRVGDKASNTVDVYIVDGFVSYNLIGSDVYFECAKPDNTSVRDKNGITMIDAAKGHFEYTFPTQTFASVGKSKQAYFTVEKNSTVKATTQDFVIVSLPDALTNRIPSKTYISQLEELIWQLEQIELDLLNSEAYREAHDAKTFAEQAKLISESVQEQLNQIVINGSIDPETKQARVDKNGKTYETLKIRIDAEQNKIAILNNSVGKSIENYSSLKDALTSIGSNNTTLVISKDTLVTENVTIPPNVTLKFVYPHKLIVSDGVTITLNGSINADNYHIFGGLEKSGNSSNIVGKPIVPTIYARWFGAKLDNITDDTTALNKFLMLFGAAELVIDNGTTLITNQLLCRGKWNPTNDNSAKRLTFKGASINYQGPPNKACMQIYNHQKSIIDGLSVLKGSVSCYVNIVGFWYSKLLNYEIPKLTFNKNISDIPDTILTNDSYTSIFQKGVTFLDTEFYGIGTSGGGYLNSLSFKEVIWQGNQFGSAQYNLKYFGTSFQNMSFTECDLSYCSIANIYIDAQQSAVMRLNFYSCYLDSTIPIVEKYDFKGATINTLNCQMANSQKTYIKLKNFLSSYSNGNYSLEAGSPKSGGLNLIRNGDFLHTALTGWQYSGNDTVTGNIGNPTVNFVSNINTINGNSVRVNFNQTQQYWGINAVNAPVSGLYSVAFRIKKVSGNGSLQISFKPNVTSYDMTPFDNDEELLLTINAEKLQGSSSGVTLKCTSLTTSTLVVEIMEVTLVPGTSAGINLLMHPSAIVYPTAGSTSSRPIPYRIGQSYFDLTINKPIFCKNINPAVWVDSTGGAV
ncbi:BppU family phage baseplate upper protein [Bacillus cereus]|uniref:BppU family phage baseplate upper protein n=1 Tax=Bacillus cereus TaxID=1396 RepID=UPI000BF4F190|nr:BppU family phage baseplate upper protein [Bacillus cereus]PEW16950.1 hypothetical protein CN440_01265 [Bacillus cereus]